MGYWQNMRNLNVRLPDCEERGPPILFLSDWDFIISGLGSPTEQHLRVETQCSLMEWNGNEWFEISDFNPQSINPTGADNTDVINVSRFGDDIWIGCEGYFCRSRDGGSTFEVSSPTNTAVDGWVDKAADNTFWVAQESFGSVPAAVYRSSNGIDWELVTALPPDAWLSDGPPWGPNHVISCHPSDPSVVIVAFNSVDLDPDFTTARYVYVTKDGGATWSAVKLPNQFTVVVGDNAAEGFFATGDQGFNADGVFFIAYEVERYSDPFALGPDNKHYFWVAKTSDYASFTATDVTPFFATHFGFQQRLYIYGDILFHAWAQDHDGAAVEGFGGFEGLATHISLSTNGGETWTYLTNWLQPISQITEMPGYVQDLFYDPDTGDCWVFFAFFDSNGSEATFNNIAQARDNLQWIVSGTTKTSVTGQFMSISGLPDPHSFYASTSRPWPAI